MLLQSSTSGDALISSENAAALSKSDAPSFTGLVGNNIDSDFTQKAGSFLAETTTQGADAASKAFGFNLPNSQNLSAQDINSQAPIGNDGKQVHITDEPMPANVAQMILNDKKRQLVNENMNARYENANGIVGTAVAGLASTLADPASLAAMSYGGAILGGGKALAGLEAGFGIDATTTAARVGARVISGAAGGAASMVPLAGAQLGISAYQGGDYDVKSALSDMAFGAVGGALIHGGFGSALHESGILKPDELMRAQTLKTDFQAQAADILRQSAPVKAAAMNSTIADVVSGRPADPSAVIGKDGQPPNLSQIADDRKQQNQNGYSPNMTPEEIAAARKTILPNGLKVEPQPSRLPDAEINRYKGTVQTALQNAGVENVDDSVVQEIARMKAEQINPENAVKPRPVPVPSAEIFPKLPQDLAGAKSGYKKAVPQFASDVDKALYTVPEKSGKANNARHADYIDYLKNTVGLSDGEIRRGSKDVLNAVKQHAEGKDGNVDIPQTFKREFADQKLYSDVPAPPPTLTEWLAKRGGVKDEGGDLRAMDANKVYQDQVYAVKKKGGGQYARRGKAFAPNLIQENGAELDAAARDAGIAGYFPEKGGERPTIPELKAKIEEDLHNHNQFSDKDHDAVNAHKEALKKNAEVDQVSHETGIDTEGKTHKQFWDEVRQRLSNQEAEAKEENFAHEAEEESQSWRTESLEPEELEALENERKQANDARDMEPIPQTAERSEHAAGDEGVSEEGNGLVGRGSESTGGAAEGAGADTGRAGNSFEPAKNVAGGGEQGVLGGMEQSAKQAMAARGEKIKPKVEQKPANEGLFQSVIGGGDELDLRIADAEKTINSSGMTVEERADLQQAYKEAADADKIYSDKMKELGQCLGENGVA